VSAALRHPWSLDPTIRFLNHGSFGACPKPVLAVQQRLREQMEREPVRFFLRELEGLLDDARRALADFIGADAEGLAFVPNVTSGVNAVLRSFPLVAGDELLVSDHAYNACRTALDFVAAAAGARVVVARIPFPIRSPADVVEAMMACVGPRTRLALVEHVTSPTGLVFPIARLVRELDARGVETLVDGAHAAGMVALDVQAIAPTYYAGNCHKWLCAPKGAGFLYVRRDRQQQVRPLAISHGANSPRTDRSRFRLEFDWSGTDDPTAYLCIPDAIRFMASLMPGGWPDVMGRNRALALEARTILCAGRGIPAPCPDEMIGSLATVPLPDGLGAPIGLDPLQNVLFDRFAIEVPVMAWPHAPKRLIRVSCQLYNERADYEALAGALRELDVATP